MKSDHISNNSLASSKSMVCGWRLALLVLLSLALFLAQAPVATLASEHEPFPEVIPLPDGFNPEGIVIGRGATFYVGSLATGAIYRGDLLTGEGELLVQPQEGRSAAGLAYDRRTDWLYVAGSFTGQGYIYDAETGENIASFQFASESTFINDVVVTGSGAYFTDSSRPVLYRVPLRPDGTLPEEPAFHEIPLGGDFTFLPGEFNANGIDATPRGRWLIIVHSTLGALYVVDPKTGYARQIDLGGATVERGDGILVKGRTIYVVQNFLNQIAVIKLTSSPLTGEIVDVITSPLFRIPTTIDDYKDYLYVVNARFDVEATPETEYEVVRVPKP